MHGHPSWALGYADEVWWSRLAHPDQHGWVESADLRKLQALACPKGDPDPKALACDGRLVRRRPWQPDQLLLRFVEGRPVSAVTTAFLAWGCERLTAQGVRALLLSWDNASWHKSQVVRTWLLRHNQLVRRTGQGVRIVPCLLPTNSPWLNPIEPTGIPGQRALTEPDRLLSATELEARGYAYYRCPPEAHLLMPKQVA